MDKNASSPRAGDFKNMVVGDLKGGDTLEPIDPV